MLSDWMSSWDQMQTLPVAVRLNVEFNEEKDTQWPVLMAGVRVDEQAVQTGLGRRTYQEAIQDLMRGGGSTQ